MKIKKRLPREVSNWLKVGVTLEEAKLFWKNKFGVKKAWYWLQYGLDPFDALRLLQWGYYLKKVGSYYELFFKEKEKK